jgi:hypothetical protein
LPDPSPIDGRRDAEEAEELGLECGEFWTEEFHLPSGPVETVALQETEQPQNLFGRGSFGLAFFGIEGQLLDLVPGHGPVQVPLQKGG